MPFAIHTIEIPDGGVIIDGQLGIANAAGGGAGASRADGSHVPGRRPFWVVGDQDN